jgi:ectoine hydroxylase-related dioxygenase (phytanoyl-CoA dioxygenase family)
LMGGPVCFSEICVRHMAAYDGEPFQNWHRDRPRWDEHPFRMDYIQLMLYLSDVDETTHCFSISPEPADAPQREKQEQLAAGDIVDLYGPAGTAVLFNIAVLHSASVRVTQRERKTVQVYYGHRQRPALSNDSTIPATLWRDHDDAETRAFYGNLNEKTRRYLAAF